MTDDMQKPNQQDIFEELFLKLMDGFGRICEDEKVATSVAIAQHPDSNAPIVFVRGNMYEVAKLLTYVLRHIKAEISNELEA